MTTKQMFRTAALYAAYVQRRLPIDVTWFRLATVRRDFVYLGREGD